MEAQKKATKLTEEANAETKKRVTVLSQLEQAEKSLKIAQSEDAIAVQKIRVETQELNKANKEHAKNMLGLITPYQKFAKEVNEAKKTAKSLGVEMVELERKFKKGEITQKEYNRQINKLSGEYVEATVKAKGLDSAVKRIDSSVGDSQRNVGNYKSALGGLTSSFKGMLAAFGVVGAMDMFAGIVTGSFETVKKLNAQNYALQQIFETESQIAFQKQYLSDITNRYGLELVSTTDAYTKYAAAIKGTYLEGEKGRAIFESFSGASAKLGLSAVEQAGIFKALEQMISKGKIQAEELRGQLGDRMAGAFKLFAAGIGVSTIELDNMLKKGEVIADDVLPRVSERLNETYDLSKSSKVETLVSAQTKLKNAWTEFLDETAGNKEFIDGLATGMEGLGFVLNFLLDTLISKGADGTSVVGDLVDVIQSLFEAVGDMAEGLGLIDEKTKNNLFSLNQFQNDLKSINAVISIVSGSLRYLIETVTNFFSTMFQTDGWDKFNKKMEASADKLLNAVDTYNKVQDGISAASKKGLAYNGEANPYTAAWQKAQKEKVAYFQLNGKYFTTKTGKNTGKSVDDYIDRGSKLVAKEKAPQMTAAGLNAEKAAKEALSAAKKRAREEEAARKKAIADQKREDREAEKIQLARYNSEKENIDKTYQLRIDAIKNNINLSKEDPHSSESDKLANQIKFYSELIKANDEYYNALITNAKKNSQEKFIPDFERQRDIKSGEFQHSQLSLSLKTPEAAKADLEYSQKIAENLRLATTEEQKSAILNNSNLSVKEREFLLSVNELENKKEGLEIDRTNLLQRQAILISKGLEGKLTREENLELAENAEILATSKNEIEEIRKEIESIRFKKIADGFAPIIDLISNGLNDLGLTNVASQFSDMYQRILKEGADFKMTLGDYMMAAGAIIGDFATQLVEAQTEKRMEALDAQLKASQSATDQELGFIDARLERLNSLENATKEQISERNALEDEARTVREQQIEREKQIEAQRAKAQQRAQAQQALISGGVAAINSYASLASIPVVGPGLGLAAAIAALSFAGLQAAFIMSKDPVPQYFVGRSDGPEEMALTQERGREIIASKSGKVKSLGNDKGATLTKLSAGDKVFTAAESYKMFSQFPNLNVGDSIHKIDNSKLSPIILQQSEIDYDKLASKIKDGYEQIMRKFDKITTFEDEDGNMYRQKGGQIPEYIGKKRVPRQNIEIKIKNRNVRD